MGVSAVQRALTSFLVATGLIVACGSDPTPSPAPLDEPGPPRTLACESDEECDAGEHCDPFSGCVECLLNAHCADGERCTDSQCITPTACASSDDCEGDEPVCNFILGECVGCVGDEDCGETAVCQNGRCEEVMPCVNTRDCDSETVCERDLGYCVRCVSDGDCSEETTCVENTCIPRCASDNDCRSDNLLCNHEVGYCVECVEHVDCPDVYHCRSGRCAVDTCVQSEVSCVEGQNAVQTCNEEGSEVDVQACPFSTTCADLGTGVSCVPWVCQPGAGRCNEAGSALEVCDSDGLGYSEGTDCEAMDGLCENNACTEIVCAPGETFCEGTAVYQCGESGTSFTSIQACGVTQFCETETASCQNHRCTPGSVLCDGSVATLCASDGSGPAEDGTDCADDDQVCYLGACADVICEDTAQYCRDGQVFLCENGGATERVLDTCTSNEYCDEESAFCRVRTCTPEAAVCDGEIATTCDSEGSGVLSGGTDCAQEEDSACFEGECLPKICADIRYCKDGNVYDCLDNGTSDSLYDTCTSSEFCDESISPARCRTQVCTPESVSCVDNSIAVCEDDGSGYTPTTPCDNDEACVAGTCLPVICNANAYYCEGQEVYRCGNDGTTTSLIRTCTASYYCEDGLSACQLDVCTAGQPACDGELVSTCEDDGSGALPGGTACPSGETCDGGACAPIVCTASERFCDGQIVRLCNDLGTNFSTVQTCSATYFCDESAMPIACTLDICEADAPGCDGETLAVCQSDGGGYTSQTDDCSSNDMVCAINACAAEAIDTVGDTTSSASLSNYGYSNRYYMTTSRTLTEIEQYVSVSGTSQFTWYVFEGTGPSGSYTKIFESLNTSSGSAVFHSSGTIDVPLQAGMYYLIGVRVAGSATRFYQSQSRTFLSFGQWLNSGTSSMSSSVPSSLSVSTSSTGIHQRLTTQLP